MTQLVQYQTKEGQPVCRAASRTYATSQRAIRLALGKGFTSVVAIDADGRTYDYTTCLTNRQKTQPCSA